MAFKTSVTQCLRIKHRVVQRCMTWVGQAELVAAVFNSGGLSILSAPASILKQRG